MQYSLTINTNGFDDIVDITQKINELIFQEEKHNGLVNIFVKDEGTILLSKYDYIKKSLEVLENKIFENEYNIDIEFDKIAQNLKSALLKNSLTVPFKDKKLLINKNEKLFLVDTTKKQSKKEIIITIIS